MEMVLIIKRILSLLRLIMMMGVISIAIVGLSLYWVIYFPIWYLKRVKREMCKK
jgi:hypothetical protein